MAGIRDPRKLPVLPLSTDPTDIGWAAGVFEGEGCIYLRKDSHSIALTMGNTDSWLMDKWWRIIGRRGGFSLVHRRDGSKWQDFYHWSCGTKQAFEIMDVLYPHLSLRRQARWHDALEWASKSPLPKPKAQAEEKLRVLREA